jgi:hypothetical protein
MDRFRVKTSIPGRAGELMTAGQTVSAEDLTHADKAWLIRSGAIEVVGSKPARNLLPDQPTDQDYRDEIERLQSELVKAEEAAEAAKSAPPPEKKFATGKEGQAADNASRKIRDAESERDAAEKRADAAEAKVARLTEELDRYATRVTELEREVHAAKHETKTAATHTPDGREIPKGGSGTAPPKSERQ